MHSGANLEQLGAQSSHILWCDSIVAIQHSHCMIFNGIKSYKKEDINLDESVCFWRTLPNRGFGQKGKDCRGGGEKKNSE